MISPKEEGGLEGGEQGEEKKGEGGNWKVKMSLIAPSRSQRNVRVGDSSLVYLINLFQVHY